MIFDTHTSVKSNEYDYVQESPYALGIEGGLMHVYENECNFNAIMKSAGLAELKYFKECGGDLFVHEAETTEGFIDKFIKFFERIIENIVAIFKKFVAKIAQYVASDKKFVSAYKEKVLKDFKEFKFTGYNSDKATEAPEYSVMNSKTASDPAKAMERNEITDEEVKIAVATVRKEMAKASENIADNKAFKDALVKLLIGEKSEFTVSKSYIEDCFDTISDAKQSTDAVNKKKDTCIKQIKDYIKKLKSVKKAVSKDDADKAKKINNLNKSIGEYKEYCNIATIAFSAEIDQVKTFNRQCKAICVKALTAGKAEKEDSKEPKALPTSESSIESIFADVEII